MVFSEAGRRLLVFFLYLTHPQVIVDPTVAVSNWGLSDVGRARVDQFGGVWLPIFP